MHSYIYAIKDGRTARFSEFIWRAMGERKNGWSEITEAQFLGKAPNGTGGTKPPEDLTQEKKYRTLYDQAKGLEKDGKLGEALTKYQQANAIKPSATLKGIINKLTPLGDSGRGELVKVGDDAMAQGDFSSALEAYQSAQEMKDTPDVAAMIRECKEALELN